MADAQAKYDEAVKKLNTLLGVSATDYAIDQAQAQLQIAQSRLELAQNKYDLLLDGPDPKEVESAEARITTAEATLKATRAALDKLELRATIDGSVVDMNLIPGQQVSPGQVGMLLVNFSRWYVETDNLTEIQVVDVAPGQKVTLVPDALRSVSMSGVVDSISRTFEDKGGDITYTVRILVEEIDPRLRWGMTVTTRFEVE
jgi:multidrug resistance efflux pump